MLKEEKKKLAFGYTRVSTEGQARDGDSLADQEARIREYATSKGLALRGIYQDVSGALPGKKGTRLDLEDALTLAKNEHAVLIVTDVDRLTRSSVEMEKLILSTEIDVHVVSLNRRVGKHALRELAKEAEIGGTKIGYDTKNALAGKAAHGSRLGPTKKTMVRATLGSLRQRSINAWKTVTDIAMFISADPKRMSMNRRELVDALSAARMKTSRGNEWTVSALTRPLRKARAHIALQNEPDDDPLPD